jgi:hypothetical protein
VFSLAVARAHVDDLQREAEQSSLRHDARMHTMTPLRRLVRRARNAR